MLACPYGFNVDAQGCPYCSCRTTPRVCLESIVGYNCGTVDHRDCPSSHECHLSFSNLYGQCCLKTPSSTTVRPPTSKSTVPMTTVATGTSTRRPMGRLLADITQPASSSPVSTTPSPTTTGSATGTPTSTQRWFLF
ncbi:unnamed protein product [Rotaria sordida]|uniref:Antistasin-like domain-containing protein n=1 Tax=Rotaria sordida TaxID=392033 RepID=A0A814BHE0_9BILA|nr:unnamed protein product [Rotaria sordida]CAF0925597.1 unnamed protein product [Rotaria sordida]CAF0928373.1 unnamed protein product [Rotaria sordida]CAF0963027.1 unnamed protein product [Rotaria sordida]CAF3514441.1 unnamed protein product [Rotaria sordida]